MARGPTPYHDPQRLEECGNVILTRIQEAADESIHVEQALGFPGGSSLKYAALRRLLEAGVIVREGKSHLRLANGVSKTEAMTVHAMPSRQRGLAIKPMATTNLWRNQYVVLVHALRQLSDGGSTSLSQLFPKHAAFGRTVLQRCIDRNLVREVTADIFTCIDRKAVQAIVNDEAKFCELGGFESAHAEHVNLLLRRSADRLREAEVALKLQPVLGYRGMVARLGRSNGEMEALCGTAQLPHSVQVKIRDSGIAQKHWRTIRDAGDEAAMIQAIDTLMGRMEPNDDEELADEYNESASDAEDAEPDDDGDLDAVEIAGAALKLAMATHRIVERMEEKLNWLVFEMGYPKKPEGTEHG